MIATTTRASEMASSIAELAGRLQHDLEQGDARQPLYAGIRELRRTLNTLEHELRDDTYATLAEGC